MVLSFLYLMARRLVGMLLGCLHSEHAKDVEIAVLRHQLEVLRRQVKRPEFRPADRAVLAVLSRALPRSHWSAFLVTPATILRWHRRLVTRNGPSPTVEAGVHRSPSTWWRCSYGWPGRILAGATGASRVNSRSSGS
jgi:putative transposase